ncbi:MAG: winged helix-turn-helix domain-containing protein, partial [Victivallales bacterium]
MNKANGYIDVYNTCRNQILNGEISSGERLPSIRELAKFRNVSMVTAQRAVAKLQQDGYIKSNGRHGCVVINEWMEPAKNRVSRHEE